MRWTVVNIRWWRSINNQLFSHTSNTLNAPGHTNSSPKDSAYIDIDLQLWTVQMIKLYLQRMLLYCIADCWLFIIKTNWWLSASKIISCISYNQLNSFLKMGIKCEQKLFLFNSFVLVNFIVLALWNPNTKNEQWYQSNFIVTPWQYDNNRQWISEFVWVWTL